MFSNAPRLIFPLPQGEVLSGVTTWTWRISATCDSRKSAMRQASSHSQMRNRKFDKMSMPCGVCVTSG